MKSSPAAIGFANCRKKDTIRLINACQEYYYWNDDSIVSIYRFTRRPPRSMNT